MLKYRILYIGRFTPDLWQVGGKSTYVQYSILKVKVTHWKWNKCKQFDNILVGTVYIVKYTFIYTNIT
jgi:hypothetical protein